MLSPSRRPWLLLAATLGLCGLFMGVHLTGNLSYVLPRRALILTTLLLVGCASGVATLLFQTISQNRILTPSVMGFEALFVLIQTALVFFAGVGGLEAWPPLAAFLAETALMVVFASLLYRWMFTGHRADLYLLLLAGLVIGILFRSLSGLMQRLLAPGEFNVLQARLFASLTMPDPNLIAAAAVMIVAVLALLWRWRDMFDVVAQGRDVAIGLGVDYRRAVTRALIAIAILVSATTALIGPLTFLGFMAATLAYPLADTYRHASLLVCSGLLGIAFLTGGQLVLEHVLGMSGTLGVVVEFVGGGLFLLLLLRKGRL